jgi:hypothetical protein
MGEAHENHELKEFFCLMLFHSSIRGWLGSQVFTPGVADPLS